MILAADHVLADGDVRPKRSDSKSTTFCYPHWNQKVRRARKPREAFSEACRPAGRLNPIKKIKTPTDTLASRRSPLLIAQCHIVGVSPIKDGEPEAVPSIVPSHHPIPKSEEMAEDPSLPRNGLADKTGTGWTIPASDGTRSKTSTSNHVSLRLIGSSSSLVGIGTLWNPVRTGQFSAHPDNGCGS